MARWVLLWVAAALAACYRPPQDEACSVRCDPALNLTCPSGLACGTDHRCFAGTQCDQSVDASTSDVPAVDAPDTDAPILVDGTTCYGTGLVSYCPSSVLPPAFDVPVGTTLSIDTSDPPVGCTEIISVNGIEVCVRAATSLLVQGTIRAVGRRPLVLFGRDQIFVTGLIDVSSGGAGTSSMSCASTSGSNQPAIGGSAGGGAGGSFAGTGGQGGAAFSGVNPQPGSASSNVVFVHAGCRGGAGGRSYLGTGPGAPGAPGGAVYLLASGPIQIMGSINAAGAGGGGGQGINNGSTGGGGGGSGGLIFLDAMVITLGSGTVLLAEGGAGGGGSSGGTSAGAGGTPRISSPETPATGGVKMGLYSGNGGAGSGALDASGVIGTDAKGSDGGAGGGGGGAGAIRYKASTLSAGGKVYPPMQQAI